MDWFLPTKFFRIQEWRFELLIIYLKNQIHYHSMITQIVGKNEISIKLQMDNSTSMKQLILTSNNGS